MKTYSILTIWEGCVSSGTIVGAFALQHGHYQPAILLGRDNPNDIRVVPVRLTGQELRDWRRDCFTIIQSAGINRTSAGELQLISSNRKVDKSKTIIVITKGRAFGVENDFPGKILSRAFIPHQTKPPEESIIALVPDEALFRIVWNSAELYYRTSRGEVQIIHP